MTFATAARIWKLYTTEQHDDLLYDFSKSAKSIAAMEMPHPQVPKPRYWEAKLHTRPRWKLSVYSCWLFVQRRFRERQCDWFAGHELTRQLCFIKWWRWKLVYFILQPSIQQLLSGLVCCSVHPWKSPYHHSILQSKRKEGLSQIRWSWLFPQ